MSLDQEHIDAAVAAISDSGRLNAAQNVVARAAPSLQKVLAEALKEGGWFDTAHNAAVKEAIENPDPEERLRAVRVLFAEETRLSMLVGVAVGLELGRELGYDGSEFTADSGEAGRTSGGR